MKIIVGLGNPGEEYKKTRHNIGFIALDVLAEKNNLKWKKSKKFKAEIASENNLILIKPQTMMNNSGQAVKAVMSYYKLLPKKIGLVRKKDSDLSSNLSVVHDDLDIKLGDFKLSRDSRSAGHKGVQSIIEGLKTKKFERIRIGIKTDDLERIPAEKFVLGKFKKEEEEIIENIIKKIF